MEFQQKSTNDIEYRQRHYHTRIQSPWQLLHMYHEFPDLKVLVLYPSWEVFITYKYQVHEVSASYFQVLTIAG